MYTSGHSGEIDIDAASVPWKPPTPEAKKPSSSRSHYLRGPIPWNWLQIAIGLGSGALSAGLAIWHLRALKKSTKYSASLYQLSKWTSQSEKVMREGLHRLERAGLVHVERPPGRSPIITIIEAAYGSPSYSVHESYAQTVDSNDIHEHQLPGAAR